MAERSGSLRRSILERRRQLAEKIAKLRALEASPEANESATAKTIANKLQAELDGLPQIKPAVMTLDPVPLVHGKAMTPFSHRYFQVAEFAARWSGLLIHATRELMIFPRVQLYGPKRHFTEARRRFQMIKELLDEKLQAWVDEQDREVSPQRCDEYTRSFLLGLNSTVAAQEPAEHKISREERYEAVKAAHSKEFPSS